MMASEISCGFFLCAYCRIPQGKKLSKTDMFEITPNKETRDVKMLCYVDRNKGKSTKGFKLVDLCMGDNKPFAFKVSLMKIMVSLLYSARPPTPQRWAIVNPGPSRRT